jgi:hypothetical protein
MFVTSSPCKAPPVPTYRYQPRSEGGFAEMALFPGLQSLRLGLDNPPEVLHLSESLSALTALTLLELLTGFTATGCCPAFRARTPLASCMRSKAAWCKEYAGACMLLNNRTGWAAPWTGSMVPL